VQQTGESCSVATLDLPDIVYVARVPTRRIMTIALGVGTRLPAYATSMGRVLLADLPAPELDDFLGHAELKPFTDHTITDPDRLGAAIEQVREQGWALVDQELEIGLRSVAAPIKGRDGRAIAALNASAAAPRVSVDELRSRFLPTLLETAEQISASLVRVAPPLSRG
jgi:IclR family pca regulon transcriptional regulator